jgi:hypothetical protein
MFKDCSSIKESRYYEKGEEDKAERRFVNVARLSEDDAACV